jgi:streptogramin lyase
MGVAAGVERRTLRWALRALVALGCLLLGTGVATAAGGLTVFDLPGDSLPDSIAAGPDGNLWFGSSLTVPDGLIGKITPAGTQTEYPLGNDQRW